MLLNEITIRQITQNNYTGFPTTKKRQHVVNTVNARDIKFTPYTETNNLKIESDTQSSGGDHYNTFIQFDEVQFLAEGGVAFRGTDNQDYHITPLNARHNDVEVNCECLDFRFRFAHYHYNNDSLLGDPPPPYIKKTDRPPVNPKKSLGSCKHVLALVNKLTQIRILRWD